ncbi:hypothetical protein V6N13_009059 [Hibiscus sabdariffa]
MGTNMFPSSALVGQNKEESIVALPVDDLKKVDGFAGVFPGILTFSFPITTANVWRQFIDNVSTSTTSRSQARKHICVMAGGGLNDDHALKKVDIDIVVADANGAARSTSDIILTEPGLSVIISAVLTSRAISQRMKNYTIYAIFITIHIVFDFPPFMVLIIAILDDGNVKSLHKTDHKDIKMLASAIYLQVSIISQSLIFFVTRARSWSFVERPGVIWLYNLLFYFPLDFIKFFIRFALSGKAWDLLLNKGYELFSTDAVTSIVVG